MTITGICASPEGRDLDITEFYGELKPLIKTQIVGHSIKRF
jgi:hypothetical protein